MGLIALVTGTGNTNCTRLRLACAISHLTSASYSC